MTVKKFFLFSLLFLQQFLLASCNPQVEIKAELTVFGDTEVEVGYQGVISVSSSVPNDAITYYTSDETVAIIDQTGFLQALKEGEVTVIVESQTGTQAEHSMIVTRKIESYNLLFIGNSLTKCAYYDIPTIVKNMIEADGDNISISVDNPGGQWIVDHRNAFNDFMSKERFTHVVLQEQSRGPISDYQKFEDAVVEFNNKIKQNGAKTILYQTWCYRLDYFQGNIEGQRQFHLSLKEAYEKAAAKVDADLSRVGNAFYTWINTYPQINIYTDINHASIYGAFLSACVHYCTITGRNPVQNTYKLDQINASITYAMKSVAYQAYLNNE